MEYKKITIIGGGNLGVSIAQGLNKPNLSYAGNITVTRRNVKFIEHLKDEGIKVTNDNKQAVADSEVIIIAVKPKHTMYLLDEIKDSLDPDKHVLVSVVTGVGLDEIHDIVGNDVPVFRAMPNTAIAIQESMTCISSKNNSAEQAEAMVNLFDHLGKAIIIEEDLMESSTVLGACGTAYALRFVRAASQGGIEIGFGADVAQLIAAQTVKGAAALLLENGQHPEREIDKVTTPQGCTIAGLNEMEHQGFSSALIKGIIASYNKIAKIKH